MTSSGGGESSGVGDRRCIEMGEVNRKKKEGRNFHKGQNTYIAIATARKSKTRNLT